MQLAAPPDFHVARKLIKRLQRLPLKPANIDELKLLLDPLFQGYTLSTPVLTPGLQLFRGVRWPNRPVNVRQLGYPSAERVQNFQRVNRPGRPMFYSSVAREAPFFELHLRPGEHIALSRWRVTEKLVVNNAGYVESVMKRLNSICTDPPYWQLRAPAPNRRVNQLVHGFLAHQFAKVVRDGSEHEYKLSIAIAERLLRGLEEAVIAEPHPRGFAGIIYPTIAMRANSDNVALLPDYADRYLELENVEYVRVDATLPDLKYDITKIDFADSFDSDGAIDWKGRYAKWPIPPGGMARVSVERGRLVVKNMNGQIIDPI